MSVGVAATKRKRPLVIILAAAVFLLVMSFVFVWYHMNYRFVEYENGIKFIGKVEGEIPTSGTIYYSDTSEGTLDLASHTITYSNGDVYTGEITYLLPDGKGKMVYAAGDVYEGEFDQGELTGTGTFTFVNGESYTGALVKGVRQGKGTYTWPGGNSYTGDFKDGKKDGQGVHIWAATEGSAEARYEGYYTADKKNGMGTFYYANGDVYQGEFKDNVRTGTGTYTWANGETYTGQFLDDKMHGEGVYTWPSADGTPGREYKGYFEHGQIVLREGADPLPAPSDPAQ